MKVKYLLAIAVVLLLAFCIYVAMKMPTDEPSKVTSDSIDSAIIRSTKDLESDFEREIDSLRQIIPIVTGEQTFSFEKLSDGKKVWDWHRHNSQKLIKIDSITWFKYFVDTAQRYRYVNGERYVNNEYYEKLEYTYESYNNAIRYYYKEFDFKDNFFNLVFIQHSLSNLSRMLLVQFDKQGNPQKSLVLAKVQIGQYDHKEEYSSIQGNKIITYSYYEDYEDSTVKRDTVETLW